MKTLGAIALFASVAFAQLPDIPTCAYQCFLTALTTDGCTQLTDFACHCQKPELITTVQPCVEKACTPDEIAKILTTVQSTCAGVGHPISIPNAGGSSSTSAPPAQSSSKPAASSSAAATTSAPPPASYSSSTPTPSSNATITSTKPSQSAYTGAASRPTQIGALMAALGLAAVAL
jgi:cobalamin biosynthesis Mg chelatase CobN